MNEIVKNYRTSIPGFLLILSVFGMIVSKVTSGTLEEADIKLALTALAGVGLLAAKDAKSTPTAPTVPPPQDTAPAPKS